MPVTITIPDEFADQFIGHVEALGSPGPGCAVCQVAGLIEKARAALATAPVDGSGAVDALAGEEQTTCTCGVVTIAANTRAHYDTIEGSRHYFDGRPCVEYANAFVTAIDRDTGEPIPGRSYGLRGH